MCIRMRWCDTYGCAIGPGSSCSLTRQGKTCRHQRQLPQWRTNRRGDRAPHTPCCLVDRISVLMVWPCCVNHVRAYCEVILALGGQHLLWHHRHKRTSQGCLWFVHRFSEALLSGNIDFDGMSLHGSHDHHTQKVQHRSLCKHRYRMVHGGVAILNVCGDSQWYLKWQHDQTGKTCTDDSTVTQIFATNKIDLNHNITATTMLSTCWSRPWAPASTCVVRHTAPNSAAPFRSTPTLPSHAHRSACRVSQVDREAVDDGRSTNGTRSTA